MTQKLPRHSDLDSEILTLNSPFKLSMQLGCLSIILITLMTWLALIATMAAGVIDWHFWPFVAVPIGAVAVLILLPALLLARRGALAILEAVAVNAEAWLQRANFSVDLNRDGYIGYRPVEIEGVKTVTHRPAIWTSPAGTKLLTAEATAAAIPPMAAAPTEPEPVIRELWEIGDIKIPRETLEEFVSRIFVIGWDRQTWVKSGKLDRLSYDALVNLMSQSGIIADRRAGFAGKLAIDDPQTAKRILGLN